MNEPQRRRRSRRGEESRRRREDWCASTRVDGVGVQVGRRREKCGVNEEGREGREERGRRGVHLFAPNSVPSGSGQNVCPEFFLGWLGQRRCAPSSTRSGYEGLELSGQWKGRSLAGGIRMAGRGWTPTANTGGARQRRPRPSLAGCAQQQADQQTSHRIPLKADTQEWPCSPKPRRTLESPVDTTEQQPLSSHATPVPLFVQYCA